AGTGAQLRTVTNAITPPLAANAAQIRIATATRSVNTAGARFASSRTTVGRTATASRPARRAAALFTPDATPNSFGPTDASTVAVSGATVVASPRPNRVAAGRTAET